MSLFISEYIEGSGSNKAIELYNPTSSPIDLSQFILGRISNGGDDVEATIELSGTLEPGEVYVIAHPSADPAILAVSDQTTGSLSHNGDDHLILLAGGSSIAEGATIVDMIGTPADNGSFVDPGSSWSDGSLSTQNQTLRRDSSVAEGNSDGFGADLSNLTAEWEGFSIDTFDGLGSHNSDSTPFLTVSIDQDAISENGGTSQAMITRTGDVSSALTVTLESSSTSEATVPASVTIPAGQSSVSFTITAVDDDESDGTHSVTITASADGFSNASDSIDITDDEPIEPTLISTIQGNSSNQVSNPFSGQDNQDGSPLDGQIVTIEAIVVGDFQNGDADTSRSLGGFYVQEEDADSDGDATTSEGIFIFDQDFGVDVNIGDKVQITGSVSEFFGETQIDTITNVTVVSSDNTLPTAATIDLSSISDVMNSQSGGYIADLEAFEGMRVTISDTLTVNEMFQLDRFNEIRLTVGDRPAQFTQNNEPDADGYDAHLQQIGSNQIVFDDGQNTQNAPIFDEADLNGDGVFNTADGFGMGDTITGLTGVLDFTWAGSSSSQATWRIRAAEDDTNTFVDSAPRETEVPDVGGDITVASFNVLNYFTTLDDGSTTLNGFDPRGADNATEFARQTQKLVEAIVELDADILGLVELENDFSTGAGNAVAYLVNQLNTSLGGMIYDWVNPGTDHVGDDAIAVGMIYKPDAVTVSGSMEILDDSDLDDLGHGDLAEDGLGVFNGAGTNRSAINVTFSVNGAEEDFSVAVAHMKSKGSGSGSNADAGDGAGASNEMRTEGVSVLTDWLDQVANEDVLVLGDFNAYAQEDPIDHMIGDGYTNLEGADAATFVFDGQTGTLDYAFANGELNSRVTGAGAWHINSSEPDAIDYNTDFGRDPDMFDGSVVYRNSDHDPLIVGLSMGETLNGTTGADTLDGTIFSDEVFGGADNDTISALAGHDMVYANGGADHIAGGAGNDVINGGRGFDSIFGDEGSDKLYGSSGNDEIHGGSGDDLLDGNEHDDTLWGDEGSDTLRGGEDNDTLFGGDDDDFLFGEDGDDALFGGDGSDKLYGGRGADTFHAESGHTGYDTIKDWEDGIDKLDLTVFNFGDFSEVLELTSEKSWGLRIDLEQGNTIGIVGLTLAEFDSTDVDLQILSA